MARGRTAKGHALTLLPKARYYSKLVTWLCLTVRVLKERWSVG